MAMQVERKKNWATYLLFLAALIAGVLALIDAGRYMGWIPVQATIPGLGEISFVNPDARWFAAGMSALLGAIWFLVAYWLWTLNPSGWMFVIVISVINLIFLALALLGKTTFAQVLPAVVINALAFLLAMLPGTRGSFIPPAPPRSIDPDDAEAAAAAAAATRAAPSAPVVEAQDELIESVALAAETDAPPILETPDVQTAAAAYVSPAAAEMDLTIIEGIGPKIAAALEAVGVNSIYKLAAISEAELRGILADAGLSADPGTWPKQAQMAAAGDLALLKIYQDELVGGRAA